MAKVEENTRRKGGFEPSDFGPLDDVLSLWIDGRSVLVRINFDDKEAFLEFCEEGFLNKKALLERVWKQNAPSKRAEAIRSFIRHIAKETVGENHKIAAGRLAKILEEINDSEPALPANAKSQATRVNRRNVA